MSSDSAWASASGFHSSRKPSVSRTRTPGATSRLPAPPSTMSRATPARERPSSRARAAAGSVSGVLPKPVPTVLMARSWPAATSATLEGSVASPATTDRPSPGRSWADGSRTTAVTSCPRRSPSPTVRVPTRPPAPKTTILIGSSSWRPFSLTRRCVRTNHVSPTTRQHGGDEEVQAQAEDVLGRIDPQQLLEDAEGRVAGHVEREEPGCADGAAPSQPHQEGRQGQVPDDLVEEGGVEGGAVEVARRPVVAVDLEAPRQRGRAPVELLVEVVADTTDGLRDEQRRRRGIEKARHVGARATQAPDPGGRAQRDAAPDPQAALPDGERSPPVVGDLVPARGQEVEPTADDPGRETPQRHVLDEFARAALRLPPARGDPHRRQHGQHVAEPIDADVKGPDVDPVERRAGNRPDDGHRPILPGRGHGTAIGAS